MKMMLMLLLFIQNTFHLKIGPNWVSNRSNLAFIVVVVFVDVHVVVVDSRNLPLKIDQSLVIIRRDLVVVVLLIFVVVVDFVVLLLLLLIPKTYL